MQLVTLATSHDGSLVATACKASNAEHAVVRINSTSTWDEIGDPLSGHSLTVTRIAFSYDDQLILTCSRDRSWRLFKRSENGMCTPQNTHRPHFVVPDARVRLCALGKGRQSALEDDAGFLLDWGEELRNGFARQDGQLGLHIWITC